MNAKTRRIQSELLQGLRGKDRVALKWWTAFLDRAGLPIRFRFEAIGPRTIVELRDLVVCP